MASSDHLGRISCGLSDSELDHHLLPLGQEGPTAARREIRHRRLVEIAGRPGPDAVTPFDSTGSATQDLAVAAAAFAAWAHAPAEGQTVASSNREGPGPRWPGSLLGALRLDRGHVGVPVAERITSVVRDQLVTYHDVTVAVGGSG
jgi:hypothetical protein